MPVCPSDYYSLRQWTVWFIAVDRTVCYSGLYSPLPQTVIIFRLKELGWPGETAYSSLCLWYDIKIPKNNKWPVFFQNIMPTHFLTWSGISGNSLIAAIVKHIHIRKRDIKKKGIYPRHPIFINLKSNTMKNTVQRYRFYVIKHNKRTTFLFYLTIFIS